MDTPTAVDRAHSKLRIGQLAGNRFRLRLRDLDSGARPRLSEVLARLEAEGVPNYFGSQRFGRSGCAFELGRHLARGEDLEYLCALASERHGLPSAARAELARLLREGSRGERRRAVSLVQKLDSDLAPVARQLARRPKDPASCLRAVPKATRRLHLSAFQSLVFNRVVATRLAGPLGIDTLQPGDVAFVHGTGASFLVEESHAEPDQRGELARRAERFELSPSGPVPGHRMLRPEGPAAEVEDTALTLSGATWEHLAHLAPGHDQGGARRPLRVPLGAPGLSWEGPDAWLGFDLPKGSFATTVLEELRKDHGSGPDSAPDRDPGSR